MYFTPNSSEHLSREICWKRIFLMDEDQDFTKEDVIDKSDNNMSNDQKKVELKTLSLSSIFSNQSSNLSRPSSRMDGSTSGYSTTSSPRYDTHQCFSPTIYSAPQIILPTNQIPEQQEMALSFSFSELFKHSFSDSEELTHSRTSSDETNSESIKSNYKKMNGPISHIELEILSRMRGIQMTPSMLDSSDDDEDDDDLKYHPF